MLEAATAFNEDAPVLIAVVLGALVSERVLRKYAPPPLNESWWSHVIAWGVAAVLILVYIFLLKPALY